jgi:hypothetical protein
MRHPCKSKDRALIAMCGLLLFFLVCEEVKTQTITGAITGSVADKTGAVIPNAEISLLNEATGVIRKTQSNETGVFVFDAVQPGTYTVKVEKTGFRRFERTGVVLTANQRLPVGNIELAIGEITEIVTVRSEGETVKTDSAENSGLLSATQLDVSIVRGRDPINLLKVLPGVTQMSGITGSSERDERSVGGGNQSLGGRFGSFSPNIAGTRLNWSNLSLDGQPGGDADIVGLFNETIGIEAVGEMKAVLSNYSAEYGRNSGAVVNLVTKSGTKDFHGNAYFFKRHEKLNANDFFFNRSGLQKTAYRYGTPGFTIGGPVFVPEKFNANKDKVFFFYAQEHWRTTQPTGLVRVTVPTELERQGDFSQSIDQNGQLIRVIDPVTKQQFPGNILPANRINRNGQVLLNVIPRPNRLDRNVTAGAYNFEWTDIVELPKLNQVMRLDFHPTTRDALYLRAKRWRSNARSFTDNDGFKGGLPLLHTRYLYTDSSAQIGHTRTINPTTVNEFNIGIRGAKEIRSPESPDEFDPVIKPKVGYTLGQLFPEANPYNFIPGASFGGVPSASAITYDTRIPHDGGDNRLTITDNFSFLRGSHNPKLGFYLERTWTSEGKRSNALQSGNFNFGRDPNNPLDSNYAFGNALLGNFASYTEASRQSVDSGKNYVFEWFAQDTWKTTPRLTLSYGLRFSWFSPWRVRGRAEGAVLALERYDRAKVPVFFRPALDANGTRVGQNPITGELVPTPLIGAFVPGTGDPVNGMVLGTDTSYPDGFREHQPVQFGPRFGFAYDVFGDAKTAIRGGFGVTKQTSSSTQLYLWETTTNPPIQFAPNIFYGTMDTLLGSQGVLFPSNVSAQEKNDKTPTVYNYSLGIQRNIGLDTVLDISYVGNTARHLFQDRNINTIPYGARFNPANADPTSPSRALPDNFFRPFPGYGTIRYLETSGYSNYNSLQVSANRRFTSGPQIGVAYTWSKTMGLTDGDGGRLPMYQPYRVWSYGKTKFDQTHIVSINYVWELPKASKVWPNPVISAVLDNWKLSGITTFASGLPYDITFSTTDNADIAGGGDGERVVMLANPILPRSERSINHWFNTSAFGRPARGTFGNAPKDVFRGPGINNWDTTLIRNIPLWSEARYLQVRMEMYNAFNHTQFQFVDNAARFDPAGNQVNGRFGQPISTRPPRIIQFGLSFYF